MYWKFSLSSRLPYVYYCKLSPFHQQQSSCHPWCQQNSDIYAWYAHAPTTYNYNQWSYLIKIGFAVHIGLCQHHRIYRPVQYTVVRPNVRLANKFTWKVLFYYEHTSFTNYRPNPQLNWTKAKVCQRSWSIMGSKVICITVTKLAFLSGDDLPWSSVERITRGQFWSNFFPLTNSLMNGIFQPWSITECTNVGWKAMLSIQTIPWPKHVMNAQIN